jgi:hypothetical protein
MAGLSFSVFKDKIISGAKRQTIRGVRKNPIKEGETLYLWWKQRSPEREKLGEAICTRAREIWICTDGYDFPDDQYSLVDHPSLLNDFAIADGFNNWQELVEFFDTAHGLPFEGVLIEWDDLQIKPSPEFIEALNKWVSDNGLPESYYEQRDDD